jgi:myo-inositol-1(or 4)-monophosphatase
MSRWNRFEDEPRAAAAWRLALLGGRIALERFGRADVSWKAGGSMVTDADLAIQAVLQSEIAEHFPEDAFLSEEGSAEEVGRPDAEHWWVVDPVDGTNNFGRGMPGFSVSVGVLRDGLPFAGAVCDPVADWLFAACVGRGAWLNERRLSLSPSPLSERSLFAIRTPYGGSVPPFVASWLQRYHLRRFGSTALHLCYVALGGLAFVYDHHASLWDLAGAAPVLIEAGGVLTGVDGSPLFPVQPARDGRETIAFLAGDPLGHSQSLAEIAEEACREFPR